jgi:hypothetical protein
MNNLISESIFNGKTVAIPMADVQHFEKQYGKIYFNETGLAGCSKCVGTDYSKFEGVLIITDKTKWNFEHDTWENAIYVSNCDGEADEFIQAWRYYRYETDIKPT